MMLHNIFKKISYNLWGRIFFGFAYLILAVGLIWFFRSQIFNLEVNLDRWNIYFRLLWCISLSFLGFSFLVLTSIVPRVFITGENDENPWPSYPTYYLGLLLVCATLTFGILNIFINNLGVLFFAISGAISFSFGYFIDSVFPTFLAYFTKK